jgi:ubiquinone/menaquinone biosynthesis C-methylase UbiE
LIDLNPGKENRYVVQGDFHDLQFAPKSVDVVYTNSLDHAFDIDRIAREILKVLKPEGLLIVEAVQGRDQGVNPGFFESFFWKNIDELIARLEAAGFKVTRRSHDLSLAGEAICFLRTASKRTGEQGRSETLLFGRRPPPELFRWNG